MAAELIAQVQKLPNVEVLQNCYCFGFYEGNLLGIVQPKPHSKAAERLIHLRAQRVVIATGAYEAPLLFRNNDLVGIMLSSAAQRLIRLHAVTPGEVAVVIGSGQRSDEVVADLGEAGIRVAATVPPESVVAATGNWRVTGIRTHNDHFSCDLVVVCAHRVPDTGLLTQAGARLEWDGGKGAFIPAARPRRRFAVASRGSHLEQTDFRLPVHRCELEGPSGCYSRRLRSYRNPEALHYRDDGALPGTNVPVVYHQHLRSRDRAEHG